MRSGLAIGLLVLTLPFASVAKERLANHVYTPPPCVNGMSTNASISINFSGQENTLAAARDAFDKEKKEMEAEANKLGQGQLQLSSFHYNINSNQNYNNSSPNYSFSGSLQYQVNSEEIAKKLGERLAEMKRQFSMNLNANRCNQ